MKRIQDKRSAGRTTAHALLGALLSGVACSSVVVDGPVPGSTQVIFDPLNAAMLSVSGTAADDIYAVGADPGDGRGPYMLHYDGQSWQRLVTGASGDLWWISVERIEGAFYLSGTGGKILRFTPTTGEFEEWTVPGGPTIYGVWGSAADKVWAVGGDPADPQTGGLILRFDGRTWTRFDVGEIAPNGLPTLYKVWGRSAADVYIVGRSGVVLHFDGAACWRVPNDTDRTLFTVHGNRSQVVASGGVGNAVIAELQAGEFVNRADPGTVRMNGVFIPPMGPGVAVGNAVSMAFQTESGWQLADLGVDPVRDLHAVWVDPDGGIWAVGGHLSAALDQGILLYHGQAVISRDVRSN